MIEQMALFDYIEPEVGDYVERHGQVLCHIMRQGMIGSKVVIDRSTVGHEWFQVGILEGYIPYEGTWRSIVYTGSKQRSLITHYPGVDIYEVMSACRGKGMPCPYATIGGFCRFTTCIRNIRERKEE